METTFIKRRFLVAGENPSSRHLISDALCALGATNITMCSTATEIFQAVKTAYWDQVFAPLFLTESVNAFHVLHLMRSSPNHIRPMVSLMFSEGEEKYVSSAFQLGMLSWHGKLQSASSMIAEFERLANSIQLYKGSPPLISADYLWSHLKKNHDYPNAIKLATRLLDLFPGEPSLLLMLGEAQMLSGALNEARDNLKFASLVDERIASRVAPLLVQLSSQMSESDQTGSGQATNFLGIKSCVVIDPDSTVLGYLQQLLTEMGVPEILVFEDSNEAWDWITLHPEPDLIIQEWKLTRGMPGPMLVQRIRARGFHNVPLYVLSSVIRPQETPLLREFGIDCVIAKPFQRHAFLKSLIVGLQQGRQPTDLRSLEAKMRKLLAAKKMEEAERLKDIYLQHPKLREGNKKLILAEFAYASGDYQLARDLAMDALKEGGDSLLTLGILGRALLHLKDYVGASQLFEKASDISPSNIEHLCHLALCQYEAGQKENADRSVERTRQLDESCQQLSEVECHIALADGNLKKAARLVSELPSLQAVLAYMNNRSISLTRAGRFDEGILLYKRVLEVLPPEWEKLRPLVTYNLGLACARHGDYDQALQHLRAASKGNNARISAKANSLFKRVGDAVTGSQKLEFHENSDHIDPGFQLDETPFDRQAVGNKPLQTAFCLCGIFPQEESLNKDVVKYLEAVPEFLTREPEDSKKMITKL